MAKKLNGTSISTTTEPGDDSYDEYENYDDYEYDEETTTVTSKKAKNKASKLVTQSNEKAIEMKPIKEDIKVRKSKIFFKREFKRKPLSFGI